jgi:hypothetical protein
MKEKNDEKIKYKKKYCGEIVKFFSDAEPKTEYKESYYADGALKSREPVIFFSEFPTFELFAEKIGAVHETLVLWSEEHSDFAKAYARAKNIQLGLLKKGAVMKQFDSSFTKFFIGSDHVCGGAEEEKNSIHISFPPGFEEECV